MKTDVLCAILDPSHRCLVVEGREGLSFPEVRGLEGPERVAPVKRAMNDELGLALPSPSGVSGPRGAVDGLVFVIPRAPAPDRGGARWVPLRDLKDIAPRGLDRFFALHDATMLGGWTPPTRDLDVFSFGDSPEMGARLAHLVAKGDKRLTTCWVEASRKAGEVIPAVGLVSIVTDGLGYPVCAIESVRCDEVRFADVTEDDAWDEGEGDRSLADWRAGHLRFFEREAITVGLAFSEDSIVLLERFRVLTVFGPRR